MADLVHPIATVPIGGVPVRFFRAPLPVPHLPWHVTLDLHKALRFPPDLSERMLRLGREFLGDDIATVPTSDGLVTIASHQAALGLLGALEEVSALAASVPANAEALYAEAAGEAFKALVAHLPPIAGVELMLQAARNTFGGAE